MTATLEHARPKPTPAVEDGEFVDFGWRPIFKEHVNRAGARFNRAAMERIAKRNNDRIEETGDFCPIVIRHTTDDGSRDPEVVGFYGPYRAQQLPGKDGQPGKWAVYARERIYAEDAGKRKKYPRVSVEYWADENDPTGGYFDPASLLGAETPELDLGIHYSADPKDPSRQLMRYQRVVRYEASPGGSNTFAPSGKDDEKEPKRYQSGGMLSEADIQQIFAALKPTIEEAVAAHVAALNPVGADPDGMLAPDGEEMGEESGLEEPGLGPTAEELNLDGEQGPGDQDADGDVDSFDTAIADLKDGPDDDSDLDDDGDKDTGDSDVLDAAASDEPPESKSPKKPKKYAASGERETVSFEEEPDMATETLEAQVTRYRKEATDYKKRADEVTAELGELKTKYQKEIEGRRDAETKLQTLEERVQKIEASERRAVRYQKLSDLANKGFTFDPAEEIKDCEDLSDAQFDRHIERIASKYQKVPGTLSSSGLRIAGPAKIDADERRIEQKKERYAKLAAQNVMRARNRGDKLDFAPEYERLMLEDPEKISTSAA